MTEDSGAKTVSFAEALIGPRIRSSRLVQSFMAWRPSRRILAVVIALSVVLYLPFLGAVGLWDPWETQYGEVGREMLQRNNFVFPYWESAPFFSKPPLLMWLDAIGMAVVGTNRTPTEVRPGNADFGARLTELAEDHGSLAIATEWGTRLPSAIFLVAALCLLGVALNRTLGRRSALASVFVLATMPLYFLCVRQAITDTPFAASFICAMACAIIGLLDETTHHRSAWWYGFYIFCALGTLAKELLGVVLPGGILILYAVFCILPWDWESWVNHGKWLIDRRYRQEVRGGNAQMPVLWDYMYRIRFGSGLLVFAAIALPWLMTMIFFANGRDPENETFVYRYFIHDQFARLARGVHTTERATPFTYFLQQGGYSIFPWIALVPGALFTAAKAHVRKMTKREHVIWIAIFWTVLAFTIVGSSATKFPHYILPALPGLAILIGLYIHDLWDEGFAKHAFSLVLGFVLLALTAKDITNGPDRDGRDYVGIPTLTGGMKIFTDIISYNHDRPYPIQLITQPIMVGNQPLTLGLLLGIGMVAVGLFLMLRNLADAGEGGRPALVHSVTFALVGAGVLLSLRGGISSLAAVSGALFLGALYAGVESLRTSTGARKQLWSTAAIFGATAIALAIWAIRTPPGADPIQSELGASMNLRTGLEWVFTTGLVVLGFFAILRARLALFSSFTALALAWALWFNFDHWVNLSHHWTQRDLLWRYYAHRQPDEPIAAFLMDWKGETFYSRNTVKQIKVDSKMADYIRLPGRKWSLVEQGQRFHHLQQMAAGHSVQTYDPEINAKLLLVSID